MSAPRLACQPKSNQSILPWLPGPIILRATVVASTEAHRIQGSIPSEMIAPDALPSGVSSLLTNCFTILAGWVSRIGPQGGCNQKTKNTNANVDTNLVPITAPFPLLEAEDLETSLSVHAMQFVWNIIFDLLLRSTDVGLSRRINQ